MYTAIYRDFRPDDFSQVIGQDHIVKILKNQLAKGQIGHAYLFCGTRGTGKTTTARILAKALNCTGEGERPCCCCQNCIDIRNGNFVDVVEIDAASNTGVDSIRDLKDSVGYAPMMGRYKVYIIDEVHMLSKQAFNALLKTLEEPPEHVVFILATTEVQQIPATIMSRCIRLDFRRVSESSIIENMRSICRVRGIDADDDALALVAANADGSVRDSLTILEQCVAGGDRLTRDAAAEILGAVGTEMLTEMTEMVMEGNVSGVLIDIHDAIEAGRDVRQLMRDWLGYFRNLLISRYVEDPARLLNMSGENTARLIDQSGRIEPALIDRCIRELSGTVNDARWSVQPRVLLEMCAVRMASGSFEDPAPAPRVQARPDSRRTRAAERSAQKENAPAPVTAEKKTAMPEHPKEAVAPVPGGASGGTDDKDVIWKNAVGQIVSRKPSLLRLESKSHLRSLDDKAFYVETDDSVVAGMVSSNSELIEEVMSMITGRKLHMSSGGARGLARTSGGAADAAAEKIGEVLGIPVDIV